ncbi:hypothetical protein AR437_09945 [Christensenella hongkongensis]|nr:hypothetical protein AR437_09945 [Christensenella hongkongensis]
MDRVVIILSNYRTLCAKLKFVLYTIDEKDFPMDMCHLTNRKNAKRPVSAAPDTAFLQKNLKKREERQP